MSKACSECKELKDFSMFNKRGSSRDGFAYSCKECHSTRCKDHRQKNPEQINSDAKRWQANNPEQTKSIRRASREKHKENYFSIYLLEELNYVGQTQSPTLRESHHKGTKGLFGKFVILNTAKTKEEALYIEAQYHAGGCKGGHRKQKNLREQIIINKKQKYVSK